MQDNIMRDSLYRAVYENFVGPFDRSFSGVEVSNPKAPNAGYAAGVLFPAGVELQDVPDENSETDDGERSVSSNTAVMQSESCSGTIESTDEPISLSNANSQSAISVTVRLPRMAKISIAVNAATYSEEKEGSKTVYRRNPISWSADACPPSAANSPQRLPIPTTDLEVMLVHRYEMESDSAVLTIALRNKKRSKDPRRAQLQSCYFQCEFAVEALGGFLPIEPFGSMGGSSLTRDELSSALIYSEVHNYALGHGCSVEWNDHKPSPTRIETKSLPVAEVHPTSAMVDELQDYSFSIDSFADSSQWTQTRRSLAALCEQYGIWIENVKLDAESKLTGWKLKAADSNLSDCDNCLNRMKEGLSILDNNATARRAFHLTNRAMFDQYLHYSISSGSKPSIESARSDGRSWRPFQIAFLLLNIKSMVQPDSLDHDILDLIWFPTGGGKTEAYLGLSAFTLILERLNNEPCNGTSIIMRYTLRLLSSQQFSRAAALICALENMRRSNPDELGETSFSIGLWIGRSTPNHWEQAIAVYNKRKSGKRPHSDDGDLIVTNCPWCGEPLLLEKKGDGPEPADGDYAPGYKRDHLKSGPNKGTVILKIRCPNRNCAFHDEKHPLPLRIIDDDIYDNPPSLLLGTVDKFATIPYQEKSYSIFGINETGARVHRPKLIIQDELHLISGPLGSMVGCYETLISELCSERMLDGSAATPKIIASTATISKAKEQCGQLFGCDETHVAQFPPSGISYDDSFFARIDHNESGRRYVGVYAPNISPATASIRLYTELLWEPCTWKVAHEEERDPYWTVVGYYNTTRELGQALTWTSSDIPERLKQKRKQQESNKPRYLDRVLELTGRKDSFEVTEGLDSLSNRYPNSGQRPIDLCLATNMISVGLDVPRLGTMVIAGQPKETSEYIQASSRVGRGNNKGIVFTLYSPTKPRDRSHYESFKSYHESFYQYVEPSSVTSFCKQVRTRALAGILVGLYRSLQPDRTSPKNPDDQVLRNLAELIVARISLIDPSETESARKELDIIIKRWESQEYIEWADYCINGPKEVLPLIHRAGAIEHRSWNGQSFPAPTSLRSVDKECDVAIRKWDTTENERDR